jgi:heat shock protein HslJ
MRSGLRGAQVAAEVIMLRRVKLMAAGLIILAGCGSPATAVPEDLGGRWDVQQIAGASLGESVDVWIEIDPATGAISGFTGCNAFSATMSAFGESLSIGDVREAAGACATPEAGVDEARFLGVLGSVQRHVRHGRSLELTSNASGEALLRLRLEDAAPAAP